MLKVKEGFRTKLTGYGIIGQLQDEELMQDGIALNKEITEKGPTHGVLPA
ncbi:MAG: hypothetical protein ACI97K_001690 [Glaciecola sp.]